MSYVILVRNPSNGHITALQYESGRLATWETEDEAEQAASQHSLCKAWPYSIVEAP